MVALLDVGLYPGCKDAATDKQGSEAYYGNRNGGIVVRVSVDEGLCTAFSHDSAHTDSKWCSVSPSK